VPGSTDRPRVVLALLASSQALAVASASVVAVALPPLGRDLGASGTDLQWVVDAFVLVLASLLVAGGVLADRRGRRGAFLIGLGVFGTGSLVCAVAPSIDVLLAGRVVQGVGPALVLPASLGILAAAYVDPAARARAIGVWAAGSGLGLASGPTLGGVLVETLGWRAVFAVNVPLCAAFVVTGLRVMPRIPATVSPHRFDLAGAALVTGGVAAASFAIIEGRELGWASTAVAGVALASVLAFVALVVVERRHPDPLIDIGLFRRRGFVAANLVGAVMFFALLGATVYLAVFFQQVQGRSALETGFCLLPFGLGTALLAPLSGRLTARLAARGPMLFGLTLAACAMAALVRLEADTGFIEVGPVFALLGAAVGIALPPATATAIGSVEPSRAGMASAIHQAMRQLGQTLGVAVLGTIILAAASERASTGALLRDADAAAWMDGFHAAAIVAATLLAVVAVVVAVLVPRTPRSA
jgi:DHA2 family methylenomycin A resistance protein-like MFS transporter